MITYIYNVRPIAIGYTVKPQGQGPKPSIYFVSIQVKKHSTSMKVQVKLITLK